MNCNFQPTRTRTQKSAPLTLRRITMINSRKSKWTGSTSPFSKIIRSRNYRMRMLYSGTISKNLNPHKRKIHNCSKTSANASSASNASASSPSKSQSSKRNSTKPKSTRLSPNSLNTSNRSNSCTNACGPTNAKYVKYCKITSRNCWISVITLTLTRLPTPPRVYRQK